MKKDNQKLTPLNLHTLIISADVLLIITSFVKSLKRRIMIIDIAQKKMKNWISLHQSNKAID
jgi:hypothetical protein